MANKIGIYPPPLMLNKLHMRYKLICQRRQRRRRRRRRRQKQRQSILRISEYRCHIYSPFQKKSSSDREKTAEIKSHCVLSRFSCHNFEKYLTASFSRTLFLLVFPSRSIPQSGHKATCKETMSTLQLILSIKLKEINYKINDVLLYECSTRIKRSNDHWVLFTLNKKCCNRNRLLNDK